MAIKSIDEIMTGLEGYLGEDTSDETLSFLQDIRDTITANNNAARIQELEHQLEETDRTWRKRYRDTFFGSSPAEEMDDPSEPESPLKFDDLFSQK